MAKSSFCEYLVNIIVSLRCDDLTFITLESVTNVKSSHFPSQTLPQTHTQTQLHRIHNPVETCELTEPTGRPFL